MTSSSRPSSCVVAFWIGAAATLVISSASASASATTNCASSVIITTTSGGDACKLWRTPPNTAFGRTCTLLSQPEEPKPTRFWYGSRTLLKPRDPTPVARICLVRGGSFSSSNEQDELWRQDHENNNTDNPRESDTPATVPSTVSVSDDRITQQEVVFVHENEVSSSDGFDSQAHSRHSEVATEIEATLVEPDESSQTYVEETTVVVETLSESPPPTIVGEESDAPTLVGEEPVAPTSFRSNMPENADPVKQHVDIDTPSHEPLFVTVDLPDDTSFVDKKPNPIISSTTTAFVKRSSSTSSSSRKQQPSSLGSTNPPKVIRSQRHGKVLFQSSSDKPPPSSEAIDTPSASTQTMSTLVSNLHKIFFPFSLLMRGTLTVLRNPLCACYLCALLGTSVGFVQFLYFSTIGYALGVALPVLVTMIQHRTFPLSSLLVVLWGIRLSSFLLWREYVNWPALHLHMQWVTPPPLTTQILGWLVYSGLYLAVSSPCLYSIRAQGLHPSKAATTSGHSSSTKIHPLAVALQVSGLLLETVADLQKSHFKAAHRRDWCHVGIWKYCTYPNYLGEGLFWIGTHLSGLTGIGRLEQDSSRTILAMLSQLAASGIGLSFVLSILRGAVTHLRDTHERKYGQYPLFRTFLDDYCMVGYKFWKHYLRQKSQTPAVEGESATAPNDEAAGDATPSAGNVNPSC